ncbi:MAG TPA: hypothetical protein VKY57_05185 [Chitinispirillaceae bacterium]|nr:hypothetical protein [Chitinispirillaceae bacterium]
MKRLVLTAILLFGIIHASHAARPFDTDDAGTVAQGEFEIETGTDFGRDLFSGNMGVIHGLTNRMDVALEGNYQRFPKNEREFSAAQLGLKFSLIPDLISISAQGSFGDNVYASTIILSKRFMSFTIDANVGIEIAGNSNDSDVSFALCCLYEGDRFSAGAEITGISNGDKTWLAGGNMAVTEWLAVDMAITSDFDKSAQIKGLAGLTFFF